MDDAEKLADHPFKLDDAEKHAEAPVEDFTSVAAVASTAIDVRRPWLVVTSMLHNVVAT